MVLSVSFPVCFFHILFLSLSSFVKNSGCGLSLSPFSVFLSFSVVFVFCLILLFFWVFFFIHQSRFITKKRVHRESDLFFVRRVSHIKNVSEYTRAHINIRAATTRFGVRLFRSKRTLFFSRAREREKRRSLSCFCFSSFFLFFFRYI